jgi:protein TonB
VTAAAPSAAPATALAPTPASTGPAAAATTAATGTSPNAIALQNPKPLYPLMSRRLGESGEVIVSVLFAADGRVRDVRLQRSSGFDRLDQAALQTVRNDWRYSVPDVWLPATLKFTLNPPTEP